MSISTQTVLPASSFRHVGIMVFLMSILMGAAGFGFISINHMVQGWLTDTADSLTIEIPAYNDTTQSVVKEDDIKQQLQNVLKTLDGDPIITDIETIRPQMENDFNLPSPVFLTLRLRPDRAPKAEERIVSSLQRKISSIIIKPAEEWENDIQKTGLTLKTAFSALGLSVVIVTIFMISGVVRTQLKASADTISLIHLLGASSSTIQGVFQRAISKTVMVSSLLGLALLGSLISPLTLYLGIAGSLIYYWAILSGVFFTFIILSFIATGLTVSSVLREMP